MSTPQTKNSTTKFIYDPYIVKMESVIGIGVDSLRLSHKFLKNFPLYRKSISPYIDPLVDTLTEVEKTFKKYVSQPHKIEVDARNKELYRRGLKRLIRSYGFTLEEKEKLFKLSKESPSQEEINTLLKLQNKYLEQLKDERQELLSMQNQIYNNQQDYKEKEIRQQKFNEKIKVADDILSVSNFLIAKVDPKLAAITSTIGRVAINVCKTVFAAATFTFGAFMGVAAAILPIFDLFGENKRDIDAERHAEIMNALETISQQIVHLHEFVGKNFEHLFGQIKSLSTNINDGFWHILQAIGEANHRLIDVAHQIKKGENLQMISYNQFTRSLTKILELATNIGQDQYCIALQNIRHKAEGRHQSGEMDHLVDYFSELKTHALTISQSTVFNTPIHSEADLLFNESAYDCNNLLIQQLNNYDSLPNLLYLAKTLDTTLYLVDLFSQVPNINKIHQLAEYQTAIEEYEGQYRKIVSQSNMTKAINQYKVLAEKLSVVYTNFIKQIENNYLKGLVLLPSDHFSDLHDHQTPVQWVETPSREVVINSNKVDTWRIFSETNNTYYTTKANNVFTIAKHLGMFTCKLEKALTQSEKKEHKFAEDKHVYHALLIFKESTQHNIKFPFETLQTKLIISIEYCSNSHLNGDYLKTYIPPAFLEKMAARLPRTTILNKNKNTLNFIELLYGGLDNVFQQVRSMVWQEATQLVQANHANLIEQFNISGVTCLLLSRLRDIFSPDKEYASLHDLVDASYLFYTDHLYSFRNYSRAAYEILTSPNSITEYSEIPSHELVKKRLDKHVQIMTDILFEQTQKHNDEVLIIRPLDSLRDMIQKHL